MKALLSLCGWWGFLICLAALTADGRWQMAKAAVIKGKSKISKVWFWLTVHRDCSWCKTRVHRAIWPRAKEIAPGVFAGVTHTICPGCMAKVLAETGTTWKSSLPVEGRAMNETRRSIMRKILKHAV